MMMNDNFIGGMLRRLVLLVSVLGFGVFLAACGGSGAGAGGGSGATSGVAGTFLALSLLDASGKDVTQSPAVAVGAAVTLKIVAKDSTGAIVPNTLITVVAPTIATLVPVAGTVLTDATGVASVKVVGATAGAGLLSVSATINGAARTATTPITVTSNGSASNNYLQLVLLDSRQNDVTANPSVAVGSQLTLNVTATDGSGNAVPNTLVSVSVGTPAVVSLLPAVGTALTNSSGVATMQVEGVSVGAGALTASATIGGTARTASVPVTVTGTGGVAANAVSISYQSASIQTLKISGAVGQSTSTLSYKVVDQNGQPVANQTVTFSPSVTTGGLAVSPLTATTAADGTVTTTVTAGTIPTPVRVRASATVNGVTYSTQSLQLSISSGDPTQKFFSLSVETFNIDGCNVDGSTTKLNARAGDQFGNPVPDGTTVNFITEGGVVGGASIGSCQTANGACSVTLTSQEYRPKRYSASGNPALPGIANNCRVSVLAYAVGQETFVDTNSDGLYTSGEAFEDLPDAFLNIEPLDRTPVAASSSFLARSVLTPELVGDRLIPFVNDGRTTPIADGVWGNAHVRGLTEVVFSGRTVAATFSPSSISFAGCQSTSAPVTTAVVTLTDQNANPLAAGSTISVEGTGASGGSPSPAAVPNTKALGGTSHAIVVTGDTARCAGGVSAGAPGEVRVKVTPVGGVEQIFRLPVTY